MAFRTFEKEWLREAVFGYIDDVEVIEDNIVDNRRWSIDHEVVFKFEDKFYGTSYSVGATEYQDEQPFEYDGDEISCVEMEPVEVVKIEYKPVED